MNKQLVLGTTNPKILRRALAPYREWVQQYLHEL